MARVTVNNVAKRYGSVLVVKNISLDIQDQEFLVLVGPSGCGKTTTLRMIAGLEDIDEGEIFIAGKKVNDIPPMDRNIAMVFQNYALYPHMNVEENMGFGLKMRGMDKNEIEKRVDAAAEILGIKELLQRRPKQLSGGQCQRVAVGRSIVRQPDAFLFDEPLSNLDAKLRVQMRSELIKLHARLKSTMIYVTHDQVEAMAMGTRIVVMNEGVIQQTGTPLEVYQRPANRFVAGFIGTPAMNFLQMQVVVKGDGGLALVSSGIDINVPENLSAKVKPYAGRKIELGIRPQDIFDPKLGHQDIPADMGFEGDIDVVEILGAEQIVYSTAGEFNIVAMLTMRTAARIGGRMSFAFDPERVIFFDPDSGEAL